MQQAAEDNDRDPAEIEINAHFSVFGEGDRIEGVEMMREAGVGRIMVPGFIFRGPSGMEQLQEFGEKRCREKQRGKLTFVLDLVLVILNADQITHKFLRFCRLHY